VTSDPVERYLLHRSVALARATQLRPRTSGEILDGALRLYQRHGGTLLALTVAPALACMAAVAFVWSYVLPRLVTTKNPQDLMVQLLEVIDAFGLAFAVGGPLFLIGMAYSTAVAVTIASDDAVGNVLDPGRAQRIARTHLWSLFRLSLRDLAIGFSGIALSIALMMAGAIVSTVTAETDATAGILTLLGILGIAVGIGLFAFYSARHSLAYPAMVIEGLTPKQALHRSKDLLRNNVVHGSGAGTTLNLLFVLGFLALVLYIGLSLCLSLIPGLSELPDFLRGLPLGQLWAGAYGLLAEFVTIWALIPVWATVMTLTYYDRRIRLEGFDIDMLTKEVNRGRSSRFDV
jgi:hypothetical protein